MDKSPMLDHLSAFCAGPSEHSYGLTTPFTCMVKGEPVTIATNSKLLLVIDGNHGYPMEGTEQDGRKVGANAAPVLLGVQTEAPVTLGIAEVRAFLGELPASCAACANSGAVECDECEGEGEEECTCDECDNVHFSSCKACRGKGELPCTDCRPNARVDRVRILGRLFQRDLITTAFRHLPGETVEFHGGETDRASILSGSWGKMLVMPLRDGNPMSDVPVFVPTHAVTVAA